ncbi:hypothetical protein [Streptomyces sp. NBC_00354]|uniref:hypothetical protein n=1 Tax=Streptomyces sp. NBC_00354 TaxID=2975723 RepID=UPI002E260900
MSTRLSARMLDGIATAADGRAGVSASVRSARTSGRTTGCRGGGWCLPWSVPGLPAGQVQPDFVFNEHLPAEPVPVELDCGALVPAASPALSPAWKLLWILSDGHPQGKDLYDAVLPAEWCPLPYGLLQDVFRLAGEWPMPNREVELQDFANLAEAAYPGTEWEHFETEYPHPASAGEAAFVERLVEALRRPAFG